jgi:hypothetical protein
MTHKQKQHIGPFGWCVIGFLIGTILPLVALWQVTNGVVAFAVSLCFGAAASLICYVIPFLTEFKSTVDSRFLDLAKHAALGVPQERFRDWLDCITDNEGSRRWIIAKYISEKLDRDFPNEKGTSLRFSDKNGMRVSALFGNLIGEATSHVCFTFPYTPKQWFCIIYPSICGQCDETECTLGTKKMPAHVEWPPPHILALDHHKGIRKRRLVTVTWDETEKNRKCTEKLLVMSSEAGIQTSMFGTAANERSKNLVDNINSKLLDVNVFDGLVVVWNRKEGTCDLILSSAETTEYEYLFSEAAQTVPGNGAMM